MLGCRRTASVFLALVHLLLAAVPLAGAQETVSTGGPSVGNRSLTPSSRGPSETNRARTVVFGSIRARVESWDWFGSGEPGHYAFPALTLRAGLSGTRASWDWRVEFAAPVLLGLPTDAVAPAPRGALGMGGNYFTVNGGHRNVTAVFPKEAYVRFRRLGGRDGQSLVIGRQEFTDGTEVSPRDATLAALKRDRIAHRLIGHFGFTHVGRSLDGARYSLGGDRTNLTVVAARPTRGVFDVNGWGEVGVSLVYGALTHQRDLERQAGEWRLFYLAFRDGRDGVIKVDNRPADMRQADTRAIGIQTIGGHDLRTVRTPAGAFDTLLWGALQFGAWGSQSHRAAAFALEGGWQPPGLARVKPWLRGGFDYGTGDRNPTDRRHATFFQVLPTPRVYARLPFFNMMNIDDRFAEVVLRPSTRWMIRADVHQLSLPSTRDLWYQGGGAFEPESFGYTGRPSFGQRRLATLYDLSADTAVTSHTSVGAYVGHARGGGVTAATYGAPNRTSFGYLEWRVRF